LVHPEYPVTVRRNDGAFHTHMVRWNGSTAEVGERRRWERLRYGERGARQGDRSGDQ
jgi:hypothetical protein